MTGLESREPVPTGPDDTPAEGAAEPVPTRLLGDYQRLLRRVRASVSEPAAHLELARFFIRSGDLGRAHSSLQVARALQPRRIETQYLLGYLYRRQRQYELARLTYRQILKLKAQEPLANFYMGETLQALGRGDAAYEAFQKAVELEPSLAAAYWHMGRLMSDRADYAKAFVHFQALKSLQPENPTVYFQMAQMQRVLGQTDRAISLYQKAMEISPGHPPSMLALAEVYLEGGLAPKAIEILHQLTRQTPPPPEAYLLLARAHHKQGDVAQALAALRSFDQLFPADPRGHREAARLYTAMGELELAEEEYLEAIRVAGDDRDLYEALGRLYLRIKAPMKAINVFGAILARFPTDARLHGLLGEVYDRFGRPDDAIETYTRALAIDQANDALFCRRARLLIKVGRYDEALRDFERARAINPANPEAKLDTELIRSHQKYQQAFEHYQKGSEALQAGSYAHALASYQEVLRLVPDNVAWLKEYLQLTLYMGRFHEALSTFERIVALEPENAALCLKFADLNYQLNHYEAAQGLYERAVQLDRTSVAARLGIIRAMRHRVVEGALAASKYETLVAAYEERLTAAQDANVGHLEMAYLHFNLGHLVAPGSEWAEAAVRHFEAIGPQETEEVSRFKLLGLYETYGVLADHGSAISALERLVRTFPHNFTYAQSLVELLAATRQTVRAYRMSEELAEKFPENGLIRARALELYAAVAHSSASPTEQLRHKIRDLQTYVSQNPEDAFGFFELGMGLLYLSRSNEWFESRKKTVIALNKARTLDPRSPWARWGLAVTGLAGIKQGKAGIAERHRLVAALRNSLNLFPNEAMFHYFLGKVLHGSTDSADYEEGTRALVTATVVDPSFAPANLELAVHYQSGRDYPQAFHYYLRVVESVLGAAHLDEVHQRLRSLVP